MEGVNEGVRDRVLRNRLVERRTRLETAISKADHDQYLVHLLQEVDEALERMENGTFGICETCHDTIESERLLTDPLARNCLDHLSQLEQRALERDLDLAHEIQTGLLPKLDQGLAGWSFAHHYEPAGPVSGDYVDIIFPEGNSGAFYFLIGDVSGKGVAASILMAHLHAIFRSLISSDLPVDILVGKANRIFCEGTLSTFFATLICGKAERNGQLEICNAGHCLPYVVQGEKIRTLAPTGLPLGMFCNAEYEPEKFTMHPGDNLVLYTDGLSEARDQSEKLYGEARLGALLRERGSLSPKELTNEILRDLRNFRSGAPKSDDLTMMVIQRAR